MENISIGAIILAITQLLKFTFSVNSKYIPITVLGISALIFGVFAILTKAPITWEFVATALATAFTSMGMWSGTKATIK